jgi:hypothetical protein
MKRVIFWFALVDWKAKQKLSVVQEQRPRRKSDEGH